jgi:hypothetical protein
MGAHTRQTEENLEAWTLAAVISAGWTVRSVLGPLSELTVGYT